jgi:tRNA(Ile)-lysidine synthase
MSTQALQQRLATVLEAWPIAIDSRTRLAVALSGGLDSTFLLAALSRLGLAASLRALHVDHGLHASSADWHAHCRTFAQGCGVPFEAVRLGLGGAEGPNLEARARAARYRALARMMQPGEVLLTAHQADDQLETLLFRLMRGAGVRGLRGIIEFDVFGPGYLARPLLDFDRREIERQARRWRLSWIEDPANLDTRFDRNYLRTEIVARLVGRWPQAPAAAVRAGRSMRDAEEVLEAMARVDVGASTDFSRLPCAALRALSPARRRNLLRLALRELGLPVPDARRLAEVDREIGVSSEIESGPICWPGAEARIYDDGLYLLAPLAAAAPGSAGTLSVERPWSGPQGRLALVPDHGDGIPDRWARAGLEVRFRGGGEAFRPAGRPRRRPLKKCFNEARLVPWMRDHIPLVVHDERIIAVADLWYSDELRQIEPSAPKWRVVWTDHPRIR